jgi:hypothetical protein
MVLRHGSGFIHNAIALLSHGQYCPPCAHPEMLKSPDLSTGSSPLMTAYGKEMVDSTAAGCVTGATEKVECALVVIPQERMQVVIELLYS